MEDVNKNSGKLNVIQASAIITGSGVGAGILAMPQLANKVGIPLTIIIMIISLFAVYFLQLMIADLAIKAGGKLQIVDILTHHIQKPKTKKVLTIIFFVMMVILLYSNLTTYITGAAEILSASLKIPQYFAKIIFYIIAAVVTIFGLKILGIVENFAIIAMVGVILALGIGSLFNIKNPLNMVPENIKSILGFLGMSMFAFNSFYNVPQVVEGLNNDAKKIKQSMFFGTLLNLLICLIVIFGSLISSKTITDPCIPGWSQGLGLWATIVGSIFTLLALLTSYWSLSFALRDIIKERTHLNSLICWLIATIPSICLAFIPFTNFAFYLSIGGTIVALVLAFFAIPAFHIVSKRNNNQTILGKLGSLPVQIIIMICYILMAVGNIWGLFK